MVDRISVDSQAALDTISTMLTTIDGDISAYTNKFSELDSLLSESQGEFTNAIKEQMEEEKKAMQASIDLMRSMCNVMRDAVEHFQNVDQGK